MKKTNLFVVCVLGLSFAACGGSSSSKSDSTESDELTSEVSEISDESYEYDFDEVESLDMADIDSYDEIESDNDSSSSKAAASSSTDWDDVLDRYERYVDKYISVMKKAQNGDLSALQECASLLDEANELSDKLASAKSDMTAAQVARYTKIMSKMASAAM